MCHIRGLMLRKGSYMNSIKYRIFKGNLRIRILLPVKILLFQNTIGHPLFGTLTSKLLQSGNALHIRIRINLIPIVEIIVQLIKSLSPDFHAKQLSLASLLAQRNSLFLFLIIIKKDPAFAAVLLIDQGKPKARNGSLDSGLVRFKICHSKTTHAFPPDFS